MRQLPYIARAYDRFQSQGFEVVSYSVDSQREDLEAALKKHRVSGLVTLDPELKAQEGDVAKRLFAVGLPVEYLVSADGTIVARDWQIEGEKLQQKLEEFFAQK